MAGLNKILIQQSAMEYGIYPTPRFRFVLHTHLGVG